MQVTGLVVLGPDQKYKAEETALTWCTSRSESCFMSCSNGKTELTEEKRELRCQGLFDEFLQNIDLDEAVLSAQELATPGT